MLDSFKLLEEDDLENEIFPILCPRAREPTSFWRENVIAMHRHSTTSFSENVLVAKTSYQMLGISSFSDREKALPCSPEIIVSELAFVA